MAITKRGFELFGNRLCSTVVADILTWESHPELGKLLKKLQTIKRPTQFLDHYAEALLARHFVKSGFSVIVETPNPQGRGADFKVQSDSSAVYVHLKRKNLDGRTQVQMNSFLRFKILERVQLPYLVSIMVVKDITDAEAQYASKQALEFVKTGSVGEVKKLKNLKGEEVAECEIFSEIKCNHVLLGGGSPFGLLKNRQQFSNQLRDAYTQFMPDSLNVIVAASFSNEDTEDFEAALFGGNSSQPGFWNKAHRESKCAAWFCFEPFRDVIRFKRFFRHGCDPQQRKSVEQFFPEYSEYSAS